MEQRDMVNCGAGVSPAGFLCAIHAENRRQDAGATKPANAWRFSGGLGFV